MNYKNAKLFGADFRFHLTSFGVENGIFSHIGEERLDAEDLGGRIVLPGLIDIHTHGNSGVLFSDGKESSLQTIARFLAKNGTTSFDATSQSDTFDELSAAFRTAAHAYLKTADGLARVCGVTMEGPFLSVKKKGGMNESNLRAPSIEAFYSLNKDAEGVIKIVAVAPELEGAEDLIREISKGTRVSVAHTAASYDIASAAFEAGASHVTHLFNAMPPLLHREPGVIGAAADAGHVRAELIADGIHIHPGAVRAAFKLFGPERIVLISDAIQFCGMPDGRYGDYRAENGKITLPDGTLAGSAATLFVCVKKAAEFGIPVEDAIRCATRNPAEVIGIFDKTGSIEPGKYADFLVCGGIGSELRLEQVYIQGKPVI